jgi:ATP-dependent DNA helicase DinG
MSDFLTYEELAKSFPFTFRGNQEWILQQIAAHINRPEIKYIVLQAPTGSGKSATAMALSRASDSSYILTSNKILQDQYVKDFDQYLADMRGRSNYRCLTHKGYDCSNSPCRLDKTLRSNCAKEKVCEYHVALSAASISKIASFNFAAAISFFNFTENFKPRKLLVIDEAHLIQDNLTNFIEFSISAEQIEKWDLLGKNACTIPKYETAPEYLNWLKMILANASEKEANYSGPSKIDKMLGNELTFDKLEMLVRRLKTIVNEIELYGNNLIVDPTYADENQLVIMKISFKPLDVSRYAKDHLLKFGEKAVFMSATIINYPQFIQSIGIEPNESVFIDVPSTFPKENRPIIKQYVGTLNYKNMQSSMPTIVNRVADILRNHKDEKGIIHTHSYDTAKKLIAALQREFGHRLLFPEKSHKQAEILATHASSKLPTVLISPSMTEGVDLKDDLGRFQVIVKVPYPSMGDKVVAARMKHNENWYGYRTMLTLIQAYGRSTRSETDYSVTYILDAAFEQLVMRQKKFLPKWFLEAIL